jgi:hypothetical protein
MDEDSQFRKMAKWALGATGLGAVSAVVLQPNWYGIIVAVTILIFALLLFGGYYLWRRRCARREREQFTSSIETQTSATPKAISDPNRRADLDRVRQKFQTGLQEYKKRGKDLYKLPWYVIIGESGSGKTEAIRHSGIDFPPGLQDELQGSGGTVNMDWWFTNRGIILDTAGSMLFNESRAGEAPEWREFLRLLKRARPQCPVNGLFLVLSVESLIRDSADTIAQKASRFAQQLDIIQRALDVRFPVYLVVTKCDLLAGFREFFDSIDDPLLQHQMFGWSNPDPLDAAFRPDLVEQHLGSVAARLRRRRMALIRDSSGTGRLGDTQQFFAANYQLGRGPSAAPRRLDEVDSLFALPESVMRLAPRLRRYLETIFVAGEWSAKPVFLRGIYFTSSMREGKALDEAIALATGLALDQLPEDRSWEKGRAFFLRDLFHEKVFRESGLVTRATNTLQLLRQRQLAIFGSAGVALLLLLVFSGLAYRSLKRSVLAESSYWLAGASNLKNGAWTNSIVSDLPIDGSRFAYGGTNLVPGSAGLNLIQYNQRLMGVAEKRLAVSWIFKPMSWIPSWILKLDSLKNRPEAQRVIFEASVLRPLVERTQSKLNRADPAPGSIPLARHKNALLSLVQLQADGLYPSVQGQGPSNPATATWYLTNFLCYLTEDDLAPDTNLVNVFSQAYSKDYLKQSKGAWPPRSLVTGNALANNQAAIMIGLEKFQTGSRAAQTHIDQHLGLVDDLAGKLEDYHEMELAWLTNPPPNPCGFLIESLAPAKEKADTAWENLKTGTNFQTGVLTSIAARYDRLAMAATNASAKSLSAPVDLILYPIQQSEQGRAFSSAIKEKLNALASGAAGNVWLSYNRHKKAIVNLDRDYLAPLSNSVATVYQARWALYTNACGIASQPAGAGVPDIGNEWTRFGSLKDSADRFQTNLSFYTGPLAAEVTIACVRIAGDSVKQLQQHFVETYVALAMHKLSEWTETTSWTTTNVSAAGNWLERIGRDLKAGNHLGDQKGKLEPISNAVEASRGSILKAIDGYFARKLAFPVALNASQAKTARELGALRKEIEGLLGAVEKPVWQEDKSGALDILRTNCNAVADVLRSLVKADGTPTEFALFFVPPTDSSSQNDISILSRFRFAKLSSGQSTAEIPDLTKARSDDESSCRLGNGKLPMDASLHLSFHKLTDTDPKEGGVNYESWGLIRLIESGKADRQEDGTKWRFKVPLPLKEGEMGDMVFEARLDAKQPLPKKENWPRTR